MDTNRRLIIYNIVDIYIILSLFPDLSMLPYLSWSVTSFLGILVLIYAEIFVYIVFIFLYWGLAYVCEGIFALRMYVAVVSPYPWDQVITDAQDYSNIIYRSPGPRSTAPTIKEKGIRPFTVGPSGSTWRSL